MIDVTLLSLSAGAMVRGVGLQVGLKQFGTAFVISGFAFIALMAVIIGIFDPGGAGTMPVEHTAAVLLFGIAIGAVIMSRSASVQRRKSVFIVSFSIISAALMTMFVVAKVFGARQ